VTVILVSSLLIAQIVPSIVLATSLFIVFHRINLVNSYPGLIIADGTYAVPFAIAVLLNELRHLTTFFRIAVYLPVILPPETWSMWLGESEPAEADQLKSLLVPYTGKMVAWPVSQRVGNVKNNDASLIEPIM